MKIKHLAIYSAIIGSLGLSGCGGGGSSTVTPTNPITTAYKVNVQVPDGLSATKVASISPSIFGDFFIATAAAATVSDSLGAGNFSVAIVDAAGVVTDIVTPESISQEADGSWIITLPGGTRVDCVIIADISKTPNVTVGETLPADVIYAPTAAEQFDIDIRSTTAYQEFIAAVADNLDLETNSGFTEEDIASLVETAQTLPLPAYTPGQTLEEYLGTAIPELETEIEREVVVTQNTDSSFSLADYVQAGNQINWYYGDGGNYFERGQFSYDSATAMTIDTSQTYDTVNNSWVNEQVNASVEVLVLTASGWQSDADLDEFDSFNADGSITIMDATVSDAKETLTAVKVDIAGQQINLFTPGFSTGLSNTATFSTGAEAYLISTSVPVDTYEVWADDSSGSVKAYERYNANGNVITTLDEIFSATASTSTDPQQMNLVRDYSEPSLELIGAPGDTTGSVNIIDIDTGTSPNVASVIGTTTWERRTVEGKDIVLIAADGTILEGQEGLKGFYLLTVYPDNYSGSPAVVDGWFTPAGTLFNEVGYTFNDIAAQDINDNFDPSQTAPTTPPTTPPTTLSCTTESGWDDLNNQPATFYSFTDFEAVVSDCGGRNTIDAAYVTGTWVDSYTESNGDARVETFVINTDNTASITVTINGSVTESATFTWSIVNNMLLGESAGGFEYWAFTSQGIKAYYEESSFSDLVADSNADGEIWAPAYVKQ